MSTPLSTFERTATNWIRTYTGKKFYPLAPAVADVDIEDIAHALANVCRFTGHCNRFYSVAEHCVHVSWRVPREHALRALLHDASEAYICDVARPLKYSGAFEGYRLIEEHLESVIFERFGVAGEPDPSIKEADARILATEKFQLMTPDKEYWGPAEPYGLHLPCWSPNTAYACYIARFNELTKGK